MLDLTSRNLFKAFSLKSLISKLWKDNLLVQKTEAKHQYLKINIQESHQLDTKEDKQILNMMKSKVLHRYSVKRIPSEFMQWTDQYK